MSGQSTSCWRCVISFNDLALFIWLIWTCCSQDLCRTVQTFSVPDSDKHATTMRKAMQDGSYLGGTSFVANHKSQLVTKWYLLERLARALDCLPIGAPLNARTQCRMKLPQRLAGVLFRSDAWITACGKIQSTLESFQTRNQDIFDAPAPERLNEAQEAHQRVVHLLADAHKNAVKAKHYSVTSNLHLVAFGVLWHAKVSSRMWQFHHT